MSRADRWKSDSQSNAEALARRDASFGSENRTSAGMAYDFRRRQPRDLREAVNMVRRHYQDEVPTKLHESGLADDGTPAMTANAEAYIFGEHSWTDAGRDEAVAFHMTPFRKTLDELENGDEVQRFIAAIVRHVTIGSQGPYEAAIAEGVRPTHRAKLVAEDALRSFLASLASVRVPLASEHRAA